MMRKKRSSVIVPVRLPVGLRRAVLKKARGEDLDFSKYVRRALRRELTNAEAFAALGVGRLSDEVFVTCQP